MLESDYKTQIIEEINSAGGKAIKLITAELSERGTPDIIGTFEGMTIVIEAKIHPNKPTKIQEARLEEWETALAIALVMIYPHHKPEHLIGFLSMLHEDHGWIPQGKSMQQYFNDYVYNWDRNELDESMEASD